MRSFVMKFSRSQIVLMQAIAHAGRGRALMSWRRPRRLLTGRTPRSSRVDSQIVAEFRAKLSRAEDLIGKLTYSLRSLQEFEFAEPVAPPQRTAQISNFFRRK